MGLRVLFISGPRQCGKSRIIQTMLEHVWRIKPNYLRLTSKAESSNTTQAIPEPLRDKVTTAQWLVYQPDRIFECLPEILSSIHKSDRYGSVAIEADADPDLRCAYPYDHRIFVMPMPRTIHEVFRDPGRAAEELHRVLDDTHAFASEIFGLFAPRDDSDPSEPRPELSAIQMRGFLNTPLGDELATRIQLKQPYHGLVESDVIVVNSRVGQRTCETDECLRRIRQLLDRLRYGRSKPCDLFECDPADPADGVTKKLLQTLRPMCQRGS